MKYLPARSGIGIDSHRLTAGRPLILGGVKIENDLGLEGHSDADVLAHAVSDALLGAAGLGDIGQHFPDTDGAYKDADSMELLVKVLDTIWRERHMRVVNVDVTVMLEKPKLLPYRQAIVESLASALEVDSGDVNFKATTGEGMGFVGRGEGAAALAVATIAWAQSRTTAPTVVVDI